MTDEDRRARTSAVAISYLADVPGLAESLIPGLLAHWKRLVPEDSWRLRVERFAAHLNRDVLPIAWVAHIGEEAVGTAALRASDLPGREDLTPWLGGVFVRPEFRGRGIASALCGAVEDKARAMQFSRMYLFTIDQQRLYAHLGWSTVERASWRGRDSEIMAKDL